MSKVPKQRKIQRPSLDHQCTWRIDRQNALWNRINLTNAAYRAIYVCVEHQHLLQLQTGRRSTSHYDNMCSWTARVAMWRAGGTRDGRRLSRLRSAGAEFRRCYLRSVARWVVLSDLLSGRPPTNWRWQDTSSTLSIAPTRCATHIYYYNVHWPRWRL